MADGADCVYTAKAGNCFILRCYPTPCRVAQCLWDSTLTPAPWEGMGSRLKYLTLFPCTLNGWASQWSWWTEQVHSQCSLWSSGAQLATQMEYVWVSWSHSCVGCHNTTERWENNVLISCAQTEVFYVEKGKVDIICGETWGIVFSVSGEKKCCSVAVGEIWLWFSAPLIHFSYLIFKDFQPRVVWEFSWREGSEGNCLQGHGSTQEQELRFLWNSWKVHRKGPGDKTYPATERGKRSQAESFLTLSAVSSV